MFIKKTKNSANQTYLHVAESYRENGKVKQRILLSLGREGSLEANNFLKTVAKFSSPHSNHTDISIEKTYIYGPLLVINELFTRFKIPALFEEIQAKHPRLKFNLSKLIFSLVASRFISPCSKLGFFDGLLSDFYPDFSYPSLQLHQIYRCLDLVATHKDEIEKHFFNVTMQGKETVNIVLYDLTTLRFESTREDLNSLARFGYSKEMRSDCTQVILALAVDEEGIPLGIEVFPGNTFEGNTVKSTIDKLNTKFNIKKFILVGDRGIFSNKVIKEIKEVGGEFVMGMKVNSHWAKKINLYDSSKFSNINQDLSVFENEYKEERCITFWSEKRAERDRKVRNSILEKIKKKLAFKKIPPKKFISNLNYKKFLTGLEEGKKIEINEDAVLEAEKRDGYFSLITNNRTKTASQLIQEYKQLWKIEDVFGEMKGTLNARPIFHWTDQSILGHLMVCFIAYYCEAHMTKTLREEKTMYSSKSAEQGSTQERPLTVVQAMKELCDLRAIPVKLGTNVYPTWVRTGLKENASRFLDALKIALPKSIIKEAN